MRFCYSNYWWGTRLSKFDWLPIWMRREYQYTRGLYVWWLGFQFHWEWRR